MHWLWLRLRHHIALRYYYRGVDPPTTYLIFRLPCGPASCISSRNYGYTRRDISCSHKSRFSVVKRKVYAVLRARHVRSFRQLQQLYHFPKAVGIGLGQTSHLQWDVGWVQLAFAYVNIRERQRGQHQHLPSLTACLKRTGYGCCLRLDTDRTYSVSSSCCSWRPVHRICTGDRPCSKCDPPVPA